jgi:hypothetical protein
VGEGPGDGLIPPVLLNIPVQNLQMWIEVIQAIQRGWLTQQWREAQGVRIRGG